MALTLPDKYRAYLPQTILVILVLLIYSRTVGFGFVDLDDNLYVFKNSAVLSGLTPETVKWAFSTFHSANWHPLTWLSLMLDVSLFGPRPGAFHATNVILHLVSSLTAFAVFRRLTGDYWKGLMVAVLFAVHPAHVESVAWISERKDVLSTFFWLLSTLSYIRYAEPPDRPGAAADNRRGYFFAGSLVLFALGLATKPMLVTLPFTFLLLDYWKLERLGKLSDLKNVLFEKLPFFLLSAAAAYVTVLAQKAGGAVVPLVELPLEARVQNALVAYVSYLRIFFYPSNLGVYYTFPSDTPVLTVLAAVGLLTAVTALCIWQRRKKYLATGWFWFLGTLVPVIGLVQVGNQAYADRYTYVPYFGLFIMLVWGASEVRERLRVQVAVLFVVGTAAVLSLTVVSARQVSYWKDSETLFRRALAVSPDAYLIGQNLCQSLLDADRLAEAEEFCVNSLKTKPDYVNSINSLGLIEMKRKNYSLAADRFRESLKYGPGDNFIKMNLVLALAFEGKPDEAEKIVDEVIADRSSGIGVEYYLRAYVAIAQAYAAGGKEDRVPDVLEKASRMAPGNLELRIAHARSLLEVGRSDEAVREADSILSAHPNDVRSLVVRGLALRKLERNKEAIESLEKALELDPSNMTASDALEELRRN